MEEYIQVGIVAMREVGTGKFLPATPLYIKATEESKRAKEVLLNDVSKLFAEQMRQYLIESKKAVKEVRKKSKNDKLARNAMIAARIEQAETNPK